MKNITILLSFLAIMICGCRSHTSLQRLSTIAEEIWGESNGKTVKLFTLTNKNGMMIKVTNYGATLTYVSVPDKNGVFENVVLGFDSLQEYQVERVYHGKTIGRYANRIGGAQFTLNGTTYKLNPMQGGNTIHGGPNGFSKQVFTIDTIYANIDSAVVALHYTSPDMEEGYPGTLTLSINYVLTGDNEIKLEYEAVTDKSTVVSFTNHSYFNLTGGKTSVLDHIIKIVADSITPIGSDKIPTGEILPVAGTEYDFTESHKLGEKIVQSDNGYDINYKLRKNRNELSLAAEVFDPVSGRLLQAYTTEPGMQFNSASFSRNQKADHGGAEYPEPLSMCFEMQHFPDSPNKPQFPSTVLNPGEKYRQLTIYKFSIIKP
jgi:aldose 1-epimerase